MRLRFVMVLFLVVATGIAAIGRTSVQKQNALVNSDDGQSLTLEEQLEVRDFSRRLKERFRATNDIGPLIDEMFVHDFSERLHRVPTNLMPMSFLDKTLIASAGDSELRRYYIVTINFFQLYFSLYEAMNNAAGRSNGEGKELGESDVLSAEEMNVLLSDPTLAKLAEEVKEEHEDETTKEEVSNRAATDRDMPEAESTAPESESAASEKGSEDAFIKSAGQLNSISATLEKTTELMRARLAGMPPVTLEDDAPAEGEAELDFSLDTLDEGEYGYPKDTQTIHVDLLPFCVELIKTNGELRILSVTLYAD